eukprot:c20161_g1_i3.p1 GENE.c20161_g1_i3~~c20161_g1_i3.p1  ORF type:complete len:560 (-),score=115.74 c20161_g1_i3:85-1626(-)
MDAVVTFSRKTSEKLDLYRDFSIGLQVINVAADGELLKALLSYAKVLLQMTDQIVHVHTDCNTDLATAVHLPIGRGSKTNKSLFFHRLDLPSLRLYLTHSSAYTSGPDKASPLPALTNAALTGVLNLGRVPIKRSGIVIENKYASGDGLVQAIAFHYIAGGDVVRLLGHLYVLGDPLALFLHIGLGFKQLFITPFSNPNRNCIRIPINVGIGAVRCGQHLIFGACETVRKLTCTYGQVLATSTLDEHYMARRHERLLFRRPNNPLEGLAYGTAGLSFALYRAAHGVTVAPVRSAMRANSKAEAVWYFVRELGAGVYGLGIKPVAGVLDFLSYNADGVGGLVCPNIKYRNLNLMKERARVPRFVAFDGVVRPFDVRDALGQQLVANINEGRFKHDVFLDVVHLGGNSLVMTTQRIILLPSQSTQCKWQVPLSHLEGVHMKPSLLVIKLRQRKLGVAPQGRAVRVTVANPLLLSLAYAKLEMLIRLRVTTLDTSRGLPPPHERLMTPTCVSNVIL